MNVYLYKIIFSYISVYIPAYDGYGYEEIIPPGLAGFYNVDSCGYPDESLYDCVVNTPDCPGPIYEEPYNRTSYVVQVECSGKDHIYTL